MDGLDVTAAVRQGPVVLVDDDSQIREAIEMSLADEGYEVISFPDGHEALTYLRASPPPPLVLLDLMLPGLDGWRVREAMLQDPKLRDVPCVVVTAAGAGAFAIHADLVLFKPVDLHRLVTIVSRFTPKGVSVKETGEFSPTPRPSVSHSDECAPPPVPPARRGSGTGTP